MYVGKNKSKEYFSADKFILGALNTNKHLSLFNPVIIGCCLYLIGITRIVMQISLGTDLIQIISEYRISIIIYIFNNFLF
jgi:hypothetical protein